MCTSLKAFFKSYSYICKFLLFFPCMHVVVFFKNKERRHVCYNIQRSRIRTYHSIVYTSFYEIQFSGYKEVEEPNENKNCLLNDTFKLSGVEKIFIYV